MLHLDAGRFEQAKAVLDEGTRALPGESTLLLLYARVEEQLGSPVTARELLDRGAPGIHFSTMNRSPATRRVFQKLLGS